MTNQDPKQAEHTGKPHLPGGREAAPTPTPWDFDFTHGDARIYSREKTMTKWVASKKYGALSEDEDRANFAFIVRAVNSYDTMLSTLHAVIDGVSAATVDGTALLAKVKAAIAKAEGR